LCSAAAKTSWNGKRTPKTAEALPAA
jgi:hypothetical protein